MSSWHPVIPFSFCLLSFWRLIKVYDLVISLLQLLKYPPELVIGLLDTLIEEICLYTNTRNISVPVPPMLWLDDGRVSQWIGPVRLSSIAPKKIRNYSLFFAVLTKWPHSYNVSFCRIFSALKASLFQFPGCTCYAILHLVVDHWYLIYPTAHERNSSVIVALQS